MPLRVVKRHARSDAVSSCLTQEPCVSPLRHAVCRESEYPRRCGRSEGLIKHYGEDTSALPSSQLILIHKKGQGHRRETRGNTGQALIWETFPRGPAWQGFLFRE